MARKWTVYPEWCFANPLADYPTVRLEGQPVTVEAADEAELRAEVERLGMLGGAAVELAPNGNWRSTASDGAVSALCFPTEPGRPHISHRVNGTGRPML